jgi:hypothetical protein
MTQVFDEVYAASAGAVNAAYFLAGQAGYATTILPEGQYHALHSPFMAPPGWTSMNCSNRSSVADPPRRKILASRSQFFIVVADAITGNRSWPAQSSAVPVLTLKQAVQCLCCTTALSTSRQVSTTAADQSFADYGRDRKRLHGPARSAHTSRKLSRMRSNGLEQGLFNLRCAKGMWD